VNPLVVEIGTRTVAWVERGWLFITSGGPWSVVSDWEPVDGLGGRVLRPDEVSALVAKVGRPTR
jgi:hypothetical protein